MDVTAAVSGAVQGAVAPGAGATPAATPQAPTDDAIARFQDAMGGQAGQQPTPEQQAQSVPPADQAGGAQLVGPEAPPSPGDAILRGLGQMSQGFDHAMQQANQAVNAVKPGEMMSTADLMKMQMSLMQVSVQQDVVGKVVGKATQNLDTFLKNQ